MVVSVPKKKQKKTLRDQISEKEVKRQKGQSTVSYSEYALYRRCPHAWAQTYLHKNIKYTESIHGVFGTAFHEIFQLYIDTCLSKSAKEADELPLDKLLLSKMQEVYKNSYTKNGSHFSTPLELSEFWQDGVLILDWFKRRRRAYFNVRDLEVVGIEVVLNQPVYGNVHVFGFVDLILYNKRTKRYKIIDIKTSTRGWHKTVKTDKMKINQLLLYKKYFCEQYNIPPDDLDVEFFVVKRKLLEESDFPQKRIQIIEPAQGKISMNKMEKDFLQFIQECYNEDGTYKDQKTYPKIKGQRGKNCTFCALKDDGELCPFSERVEA